MSRLATRFWIDAYRARAEAAGIAVFVTARGDDQAGAVLVKATRLDGRARAYQRVLTPDGRRWDVLAEGAEAEVDAAVARARRFDTDLWVLEVEDRAGRHLLEEEGLSE